MNEPKEVSKPNTHKHILPSDEVALDLDKFSDLKIVSDAQKEVTQSLVKIAESMRSPIFEKTIKDAMSFGDRLSKILPKPMMSSLEPKLSHIAITPNPAYETNKLLRELNKNVNDLKEQNAKLVAPNYDPDSCMIFFANKPIKFRKNTQQADLCSALFSQPGKKWEWDEMLEHWGEHSYTKEDWRKVYEAARGVNDKVAIKTGIENFLDYDKHTVMLNSDYSR